METFKKTLPTCQLAKHLFTFFFSSFTSFHSIPQKEREKKKKRKKEIPNKILIKRNIFKVVIEKEREKEKKSNSKEIN